MKVFKENRLNVENHIKNYKSKDTISLECYYCNNIFLTKKNKIQVAVKYGRFMFCGSKCFSNSLKIEGTYQCKYCNNAVKRSGKVGENIFCNSSCAASYNNRKRFRKRYICGCGTKIDKNTKSCRRCYVTELSSKYISRLKMLKVGDIKKRFDNSREKYNTWIRLSARKVMNLYNMEKKCIVCNYSKFVEVCHLKPVANFKDSNLISEVNDINNLRYICPTHHTEFDSDLMDEQDKQIVLQGVPEDGYTGWTWNPVFESSNLSSLTNIN